MTRRRRLLAAGLGGILAVWAAGIGSASADTSPGPTIATPQGDAPTHCPAEQYPHAGTPRSGPFVPYEIPFTATLGQTTPQGIKEGGYLKVANSLVTVTLGAPLSTDPSTGQDYGSVYAYACGLVTLPSESGTIGRSYGRGADPGFNNSFVFYPDDENVALSITGVPGLPVMSAYGAVDGELTAQIQKVPAANGGLNVDFYGGAKSTSDFGPALASLLSGLVPGPGVTLPGPLQAVLGRLQPGVTSVAGSACTLAIGDIATQGVKDIPATGLTQAEATAPLVLTTTQSGHLTGRPVTGPITGADATLVSNDFPVGAIVADPSPGVNSTTPAPGYPGKPYCSAQNASLLNQLLGLPSIPDPASGYYPNSFYAPGTFAVSLSS